MIVPFAKLAVSIPSSNASRFYGLTEPRFGDVSTETDRTVVCPVAGKFQNLYVETVDAAPGAGTNLTFNLRQNLADSTLEVTISDENTSGADSGSITASVGDRLAYEVSTDGVATTSAWLSVEFVPDADGEIPIMGNIGDVTDNTYHLPYGQGSGDTVVGERNQLLSASGTLSDLYLHCDTAPTAGNSVQMTLYKNEASTSLTATVSDTDTTANDTANSVSVSAGDTITMRIDTTGTPATGNIAFGMKFTSQKALEVPMVGGTLDDPSNSSTEYNVPFGGNSNFGSTEADSRDVILNSTGFIKDFYVNLDDAPGAGKSRALTVRKNAADTALTVTVADSDTSGSLTGTIVQVTAGDKISIEHTPSGTPDATNGLAYGFTFFQDDDPISTPLNVW